MDLRKLLSSAKLGVLHKQIRAIPRSLFDNIVEGSGDYNTADQLYTFVEEVRKAINAVSIDLDSLQSTGAATLGVASARIEITADILSTISVANDTLTTLSTTPIPFDWMDTRRFTKIVLSPGHGVPPYEMYFDKSMQSGRSDIPYGVWCASESELQLLQWDGSAWNAMPWIPGWTVDLIQIAAATLPMITE